MFCVRPSHKYVRGVLIPAGTLMVIFVMKRPSTQEKNNNKVILVNLVLSESLKL